MENYEFIYNGEIIGIISWRKNEKIKKLEDMEKDLRIELHVQKNCLR